MYKMIIADDEIVILRGLKKIIDWGKINIEIIGEAVNGKDAESLLMKEEPDLAILDICMPLKTGLEILKTLSENNKNTKIIFLSGHEEFAYVQQAIKYGAVQYLLKPVDTKGLMEAISAALSQIAKEKETSSALEKLSKLEDEKEYINLSEVKQEYPNYTALAIVVKNIDNYSSEMSRLYLFSIFNAVDHYINLHQLGMAFTKHKNIFVVLNHEKDDAYPVRIAEGISDEIKRVCNNEIFIGVGATYEGISQIKKSIVTANDALNYRFFKEETDILVYHTSTTEKREDEHNIEQVLEFISRHYSQNITLESVARAVHMNAYYLSTYFKKHTGMKFKDYVTKLRMHEAVKILQETDLKTYELAERVGFTDARYFSELFKKFYGKTPLEFKHNKGK